MMPIPSSNVTESCSSSSSHHSSYTKRQQSSWRHLALLFLASIVSLSSSVASFQVSMQYRPPVKSSVSKLQDPRNVPDINKFTSTSQGSSSSSTAASYLSPTNNPSSPSRRSQSFQRAHAVTFGSTPPPASTATTKSAASAAVSSFERRMRNLVLGNPSTSNTLTQQRRRQRNGETATTSNTPNSLLPPNVHVVHNLQEYKELVGDERNKMVAVRFYATWCRACKAVAPLFYRMAMKHPNVVFVEVPVTEQNAALHQGLGVPSLPFGHLYHPQSGLVEEMKLTRKHIDAFELKLDDYLRGSCDLISEPLWIGLADVKDGNAIESSPAVAAQALRL